jgi:hypothetical protein
VLVDCYWTALHDYKYIVHHQVTFVMYTNSEGTGGGLTSYYLRSSSDLLGQVDVFGFWVSVGLGVVVDALTAGFGR